jgi:hypothetical protein
MAALSSETLALYHSTTQFHNPKDNLNLYHRENLKSRKSPRQILS